MRRRGKALVWINIYWVARISHRGFGNILSSMPLRPRAWSKLLRLLSSLLVVSLFMASCTNKKGEERGEGSALLQPAAEGRKSHLSNEVADEGLAQGGGEAEIGSGGVEGNKDSDKGEGKADEDDAAFRVIVN